VNMDREEERVEFEFRKSWIARGDLAMIDGDATIYTLTRLNSIRSVGRGPLSALPCRRMFAWRTAQVALINFILHRLVDMRRIRGPFGIHWTLSD